MKKKRDLYCPKCKSKEIYDYGDRFECMKCMEEFYKEDFFNIPDDEILSVREKLKLAKIFKNMED